MSDCNNTDPQKLVRDGTSQEQRPFPALDPAYAPVNEHTPAHSMVFAQAYTAYLRFFDTGDVPVDDWQRFFSRDVSVRLAMAAVQDVDNYRIAVKQYFDYLNDIQHDAPAYAGNCITNLGYLFSSIGTLAARLDDLKEALPDDVGLKGTLKNLIQTQLAPGFRRLISYFDAGLSLSLVDAAAVPLGMNLFGNPAVTFQTVLAAGLSHDWIIDGSADWATFRTAVPPDDSVYGDPVLLTTVFGRTNHIATHNLFTSVFDQFLKTFARTAADAEKSLESTFTDRDSHEPHYALFLAFLRLFEHARAEMNTLTGRHLDFYFRDILQLREKPAQPGRAHLLVELAKHAAAHELKTGTLFKAGKDALGIDAFFANDRDFVANRAKVTALKTLYRHGAELVGGNKNHNGRLYASPIANSDDGLGAELLSADKSWHPFYNKVYGDGKLMQINMPKAEIGFAVASHYLLMAEGTRTITLKFNTKKIAKNFFQVEPIPVGQPDAIADASGLSYSTAVSISTDQPNTTVNTSGDFSAKVVCLLTTEKGWIEITPSKFSTQELKVELSGADPAVTPYLAKTHGYGFDTKLPVLLVKLIHDDATDYLYPDLEQKVFQEIELSVDVKGLKTLAVSNDFGPVDTSKPFQPFGASPVANNGLIVGSKELFQKKISGASVKITWKNPPDPYDPANPKVKISYLNAGEWSSGEGNFLLGASDNTFKIKTLSNNSVVEAADFSPNEQYTVGARHGFVRMFLDADFGQKDYQDALLEFISDNTNPNPGSPPQGPFASAVTVDYLAKQTIALYSADAEQFSKRPAKFFHIVPFGHAERHSALSGSSSVTLMPQFRHVAGGFTVRHEAEFYIGVSGLKPPQNLALLFQVAEGTADPLSTKPEPHLHWSYLRGNDWTPFEKDAVEDLTGELTRSGIVTLAVPREASDDNTLLPAGMHWIRVAVEKESDTVCRFILVAAQALRATFSDRGNDPAFSATPLEAGTIAKLDLPDSAVKKIEQPFATFGGRGKEAADAYYTRVSERLRHKERAIALWDYERLVLEAFPQIYKVKCLNHTHYEPNEKGTGIYRELAAGHVTVVTIPNQQFQNLRDPLRPYTSLGLLLEIEEFLSERLSCFARLHVKNPLFEELRLNFRVRFLPGFDETFYTNKLKTEITRYLSPWAYPGGGNPSFGGKIYKSVLINFVEERPYVDYVTDFKLFRDIPGQKGAADLEEVEGSTAVSILVSVPEEKHIVIPITVAAVSATAQTSGEDCSCQQ